MLIEIVLRLHKDLAPAHGSCYIGLLSRIDQFVYGTVDLVPGNYRFLDKQGARAVFYLLKYLCMKSGRISHENYVIKGKSVIVIEVQQLIGQEFFHAGAERNSEVVPQRVDIQRDPAFLTEMIKVSYMSCAYGSEPYE